jgi:hypothetical protein
MLSRSADIRKNKGTSRQNPETSKDLASLASSRGKRGNEPLLAPRLGNEKAAAFSFLSLYVANKFAAALAAEAVFPRHLRRIAGRIAAAVIIAGLAPLALQTLQRILTSVPADFAPFADAARGLIDRLPPIFLQKPENIWLAALFIAVSARAVIFMLDCFVNSKTSRTRGDATSEHAVGRFNFFAAQVWHRGVTRAVNPGAGALLSSLPKTAVGKIALARLGFTDQDRMLFAEEPETPSPDSPSAEQFLNALGTAAGEPPAGRKRNSRTGTGCGDGGRASAWLGSPDSQKPWHTDRPLFWKNFPAT